MSANCNTDDKVMNTIEGNEKTPTKEIVNDGEDGAAGDEASVSPPNDSKNSPIKKTPSKRRSFIERAQKESEELVKNMGGSLELEGGRRTRSSTRGTPTTTPVVSTPPPTKKPRTGTPGTAGGANNASGKGRNRGRKIVTSEEPEATTASDSAIETTPPKSEKGKAGKNNERKDSISDEVKPMEEDDSKDENRKEDSSSAADADVVPGATVKESADSNPKQDMVVDEEERVKVRNQTVIPPCGTKTDVFTKKAQIVPSPTEEPIEDVTIKKMDVLVTINDQPPSVEAPRLHNSDGRKCVKEASSSDCTDESDAIDDSLSAKELDSSNSDNVETVRKAELEKKTTPTEAMDVQLSEGDSIGSTNATAGSKLTDGANAEKNGENIVEINQSDDSSDKTNVAEKSTESTTIPDAESVSKLESVTSVTTHTGSTVKIIKGVEAIVTDTDKAENGKPVEVLPKIAIASGDV